MRSTELNQPYDDATVASVCESASPRATSTPCRARISCALWCPSAGVNPASSGVRDSVPDPVRRAGPLTG